MQRWSGKTRKRSDESHFPHIYRKTLEYKGLATNRFFAFGHVNWHRYLKCQNDLRPVIRARCAESRLEIRSDTDYPSEATPIIPRSMVGIIL